MTETLWTIFWGVITFSLLIVIHEGGHFLSARMFGVKVHEFMLGLPGPAIRFEGKKTVYGVTAIPLGGYVKIAGMEPGPEDPLLQDALAHLTREQHLDGDGLAALMDIDVEHADALLYTLADWGAASRADRKSTIYDAVYPAEAAADPAALLTTARAETYRALPLWKRIVVLSAGVVLNLLTAILVFTIVLSAYGVPEVSLKIAGVAPKGAAVAAGLAAGDRITKIGSTQLETWDDLVSTVARYKPGNEVDVTYVRNGQTRTATLTLTKGPQGRAFLGVEAGQELVRMSPVKALGQSFVYVGMMFKAVTDFFRPSTFETSLVAVLEHHRGECGGPAVGEDGVVGLRPDRRGALAGPRRAEHPAHPAAGWRQGRARTRRRRRRAALAARGRHRVLGAGRRAAVLAHRIPDVR